MYEREKEKVRSELHGSLSNIHFTVDGWTSPNNIPLLGIVAHYTTEDGQLKHSTLALRMIEGSHSGENLTYHFQKVAQDWGIESKMGYFTLDNARNNETMMEAMNGLYKNVLPEINWNQRRIACTTHVINLTVQAFLFETAHEAIDFNAERGPEAQEVELEVWRKLGPLGKLHNIILFIRRSPNAFNASRP